MKVTRATLSGKEIESLINGGSLPINMGDTESPYDFLSRIYIELASGKIEADAKVSVLVSSIQDVLMIYDCADGRVWTNSSKRRALDVAHAAVKLALGEKE